jgi:hypothetical protein
VSEPLGAELLATRVNPAAHPAVNVGAVADVSAASKRTQRNPFRKRIKAISGISWWHRDMLWLVAVANYTHGRRSAAICPSPPSPTICPRIAGMPLAAPPGLHHVDSWMNPKNAEGAAKTRRHSVIIAGKRQAYAKAASFLPLVALSGNTFDSPCIGSNRKLMEVSQRATAPQHSYGF